MPERARKRPRDINALAKAVVNEATGQEQAEPQSDKNPAAVELGKLGASKGGRARAKKLSARRRKQIAKKAAATRWGSR